MPSQARYKLSTERNSSHPSVRVLYRARYCYVGHSMQYVIAGGSDTVRRREQAVIRESFEDTRHGRIVDIVAGRTRVDEEFECGSRAGGSSHRVRG